MSKVIKVFQGETHEVREVKTRPDDIHRYDVYKYVEVEGEKVPRWVGHLMTLDGLNKYLARKEINLTLI